MFRSLIQGARGVVLPNPAISYSSVSRYASTATAEEGFEVQDPESGKQIQWDQYAIVSRIRQVADRFKAMEGKSLADALTILKKGDEEDWAALKEVLTDENDLNSLKTHLGLDKEASTSENDFERVKRTLGLDEPDLKADPKSTTVGKL